MMRPRGFPYLAGKSFIINVVALFSVFHNKPAIPSSFFFGKFFIIQTASFFSLLNGNLFIIYAAALFSLFCTVHTAYIRTLLNSRVRESMNRVYIILLNTSSNKYVFYSIFIIEFCKYVSAYIAPV